LPTRRTWTSLTGCEPTRASSCHSEPILRAVYVDAPDRDGQIPYAPGLVPALLPRVVPLHEVIRVDTFLTGCPPPANRIRTALEALLEGSLPPNQGEPIRFG
jgi:NAD-reducing hydrogenase small subunit